MRGCIYIGHGKSDKGGYDSGAVNSRLSLHEFKICREIGKYAQAALMGYEGLAVDLVNYDGDLNLNQRIAHANRGGYDWIAEIHMNSFTGDAATGTESYYFAGTELGRKIADSVSREISREFGIPQRWNGVDDGGDKVTDYFGIVCKAKPAAVLIETMYISTDKEARLVMDASGQKRAGEAIARGIGAACQLPRKSERKYKVELYPLAEEEARSLAEAMRGFSETLPGLYTVAKPMDSGKAWKTQTAPISSKDRAEEIAQALRILAENKSGVTAKAYIILES